MIARQSRFTDKDGNIYTATATSTYTLVSLAGSSSGIVFLSEDVERMVEIIRGTGSDRDMSPQ
jgi:hypothetical protein